MEGANEVNKGADLRPSTSKKVSGFLTGAGSPDAPDEMES